MRDIEREWVSDSKREGGERERERDIEREWERDFERKGERH